MTAPRHAKFEPEPEPGDERTLPKRSGLRVIYGDLSELIAHPLGTAGIWLVLVAAALVDTATFQQVLLLVMTSLSRGEAILFSLGFVAVSLALAHYVGGHAKLSLTPSAARTSTIAAGPIAKICFGIWCMLGLTSFLVRLLKDVGQGGGSRIVLNGEAIGGGDQLTSRVLSALLFLTLFAATGALSALVGYTRHTAARRSGRIKRLRRRAERRHGVVRSDLEYARQLLDTIASRRALLDDDLKSALRLCDADATGLKHEVRLRLGPPPEATTDDHQRPHQPPQQRVRPTPYQRERPGTDRP